MADAPREERLLSLLAAYADLLRQTIGVLRDVAQCLPPGGAHWMDREAMPQITREEAMALALDIEHRADVTDLVRR